jgi:hypothetical protein
MGPLVALLSVKCKIDNNPPCCYRFYFEEDKNGNNQFVLAAKQIEPSSGGDVLTKMPWRIRACVQLSRIIAAANCTPARKFLASLS